MELARAILRIFAAARTNADKFVFAKAITVGFVIAENQVQYAFSTKLIYRIEIRR